jgi:WD40 repeat protein
MDGEVLFVSTTDPSVEMFRRKGDTFIHVQSLEDPEDIIEDVECTPDQKWLAVACWDGAVYIYKWGG